MSAAPLILFVTDTLTVSGAEHVMFSYLDHLTDYRSHVFLRASNQRLRAALDKRGVGYTATSAFADRMIRTTWRPSELGHFASAFYRVRRELLQTIRRLDARILHSISYPSSLFTAFAARSAGIPHIWHQHDIKRIHRFNRAIYRFAANTCEFVVGPSDAVTRALGEAGMTPPRLLTVYNGIDLARFDRAGARAAEIRREFGLADDQPAVCLVGQLLPYKGHRTMIEAAPRVLSSFPTTRFFIVGALENPPYEAELRSRIAAAGLDAHFTFTGWREDVQDVTSAMDVSVVATVTPEPAALTLMESMALGKPLVASRTGGTPELVIDGETGLLFTPGDAEELAERVGMLLSDPARARALGVAGRRRMEERFSEARHLREMSSLYDRCLASRVGH